MAEKKLNAFTIDIAPPPVWRAASSFKSKFTYAQISILQNTRQRLWLDSGNICRPDRKFGRREVVAKADRHDTITISKTASARYFGFEAKISLFRLNN